MKNCSGGLGGDKLSFRMARLSTENKQSGLVSCNASVVCMYIALFGRNLFSGRFAFLIRRDLNNCKCFGFILLKLSVEIRVNDSLHFVHW